MTTAKTQYSEKLRSPKWQRKRLEVMQRDNFTCIRCGDSENILNVHHKEYIYGHEPWDYELDNFETLCESCHQLEHELIEPKGETPKKYLLSHHWVTMGYMTEEDWQKNQIVSE